MANHIVKEASTDYIQGIADVQKVGSALNVMIDANQQSERFYSNVDIADVILPDSFQNGQYSVRLSSDGKTLYSIRPAGGNIVMVFDRFAAQKDTPPAPKVQPGGPRQYGGKSWVAKDKLVFTAVFKIVSKKYAGMEIPYTLDYTFKAWEQDIKETVIPIGSKNKDKTVDFLKACGWKEDDAIPMSTDGNVLPWLEKYLRDKGQQVMATVKNGWIEAGTLVEFDPSLLM